VILAQGSEEQQAKWIPKCRRYEVVGCYAQTELAHGSNVQGLETTARYDLETKEFVISSPRIESTKWWASGLGVLVCHTPCYFIPASQSTNEYQIDSLSFIGNPCRSGSNSPTSITFKSIQIQILWPSSLHRPSPLLHDP
jgi:hypothetical protein